MMHGHDARKLILVKHAQPQIVPDLPACEWHLSAEGRSQSLILANKLSVYQPSHIFSSLEPKAQETAEIVAAQLGASFETVANLHEHDRKIMGFLSEQEWHEAGANFFKNPDKLVFGQETARQAQERFTETVIRLLERCKTGNLVVIAHGTVITLLVWKFNEIEPFVLWQQLKNPSFVVLALPEFELQEIVESIISSR